MVIIRQANERDAQPIAQIYVDSWRTTYAGLLPDRVLLNMNTAEQEGRWWRNVLQRFCRSMIVCVAEDERAGVIGFGSAGPARDPRLPYDGEVYTLYLRDDWRGEGVGGRMFVALSRRLAENRGPSLIVWVLNGNPARYFYQALGGKHVARRPTTLGGAPIEELAFAWEDVSELIALGRSSRV